MEDGVQACKESYLPIVEDGPESPWHHYCNRIHLLRQIHPPSGRGIGKQRLVQCACVFLDSADFAAAGGASAAGAAAASSAIVTAVVIHTAPALAAVLD